MTQYKLVPLEPTQEMLRALEPVSFQPMLNTSSEANEIAKEQYAAMLDAAPEVKCQCSERNPNCPGPWEPGCDLGQSEEHAKPAPEVNQEPDIETHNEILDLVAQGWCTPKNEKKVMDSDLATAIGAIIYNWYSAQHYNAREQGRREALHEAAFICESYYDRSLKVDRIALITEIAAAIRAEIKRAK